MKTLENYLGNPSSVQDEKLTEMKGYQIEEEKFSISGIPEDILWKNIVKFYNSMGYKISNGNMKGVFDIKKEEEKIAFFVFTSSQPSDVIFVNVSLW